MAELVSSLVDQLNQYGHGQLLLALDALKSPVDQIRRWVSGKCWPQVNSLLFFCTSILRHLRRVNQ